MRELEKELILYCSPTLACLKTGNLFNSAYSSEEGLKGQLGYWNRILGKKGILLQEMKKQKGRALIYVYRPSFLARDLGKPEIQKFLAGYGYQGENQSSAVEVLRKRLEGMHGFPHEIGVFLGYPLADVIGFIENGGENSKYSGYWKVYGDERAARKEFARLSKCFRVYSQQWRAGRSIWQLTVAA